MQDSSHLLSVRVKQSVVGFMSEKPKLRIDSRGYLVTPLGQLWHRIVCKNAHGMFPAKWVVHHIDGRKLNNEPDNLIALPRGLHNFIHREFPRINDLPCREWIVWKLSLWVEDRKKPSKKPKTLYETPKGASKRQHHRERKKIREESKAVQSAMVLEFVKNNPEKVKRYSAEPRA